MMNFNKLFKLSTDLICTVDAKNRFVEVSDASEIILGYTPEELRGRSFKEFLVADDMNTAENVVTEITTLRPDTQIQLRYLHKNGNIVPLLWCVYWDEEDQLIYCIGRNGKITEQTESMRNSLEDSNKRYEYVTKATSDSIWDWDVLHGTLYWGEGFNTVFGYNLAKQPNGIESWTKFIHPEDAGHVIKAIYAICDSKDTIWKEEYRYLRADGTYANVIDRGFVIRDQQGAAIRMVGAMHDISERKKTLFEMERVTEDLFKRNRELHEFGYIVSHNLRSPVANIKGISMLMNMDIDHPEKLRQYIIALSSSISRLDEVIIDLSKILSSQDSPASLKSDSLDLQEIITNIETDLAENILQTNTRIYLTGGSFILHSHKAYIYSIFLNLISNSIKYKYINPPVIAIDILHQQETVTVTYKDNGIGIDLSKHAEEIFKPYKRFHSTIEGKGLGLFLVRSHVESMNGQISVKSQPKEGVSFTITLPNNA